MPLFKPMLTDFNLNEFQWSWHKNINLIFYSRKAFENIMCTMKSQMLYEHPILIITKINIDMSHPSMKMLTHLPLDKMASISLTIFSNAFSRLKKHRILVLISLKFVPKGPINNKSTLVKVMAWRRIGDKPLSETMTPDSLTHIRGTSGRWANILIQFSFSRGFVPMCVMSNNSELV